MSSEQEVGITDNNGEDDVVERKRGVGLTILLCYLTASNLFLATLFTMDYFDRIDHSQETWFEIGAIAAEVVALVALAAIWLWRRWGVLVYGGLVILNFLSILVVDVPFQYAVLPLAAFSLLVNLLRPKWKFMH